MTDAARNASYFRWMRIATFVASGVVATVGAVAIFENPEAPRWAVGVGGVLTAIAIGIWGFALAVLVALVVEDVRPRIRTGKPEAMFIARREPSLVGKQRYRLYPVTRWGIFACRSWFIFGLVILGKDEVIDFATPPTPETDHD